MFVDTTHMITVWYNIGLGIIQNGYHFKKIYDFVVLLDPHQKMIVGWLEW